MLQMAPSDPLMDQLEERMEGWIGALRLAALSLRSRSNMPEKLALFERSEDTLVEYLVHDVLLQQFPVIQNFLLRTSILDRFCASLCEALLGEIDPAWSIPGCINWLEREELFIIPLDHRGEWYRLHHLLRDVLRTRLAFTVAPEQVRALHQQASIWLEHQGLEDEAMKHALLAEDRELVVGLIERGLRDVLNRSERTTLDRWLRQLPEELVRTRPWLLMIRAWTLHFSWQLPELSDCLDDVEALITVDGGQTLNESRLRLLRAQVAALRAQHAYFSNHAADAIAYARVALETAPASWTFLQGGGAFYTALGMQAGGDGPAAERWLLDRYAPLEDKTSAYGLRLLLALCLIHLNQGAFEKLRQSATILLQQAVLGGAPLIRGWAHYLLGVAHFQWNELDIAVDYFERAVGNGYLTHELPLQNGRYGLALIYQARGSSSEAEETLERAANADIMRVGYVEESTLSMQARLALQQGKLDSAYRWADTFTEPPPDKALLWLETPHLTRARILLSRGSGEDIQKAMSTLNALLEIAERTHNVNKRWEILAVRALALDVQGHDQAAQADLWQAIGLAQAGHATQYFVDLGAPLQQLLRRALKQLPDMMHNGYTGGSVHRILAAFPREEEPAANNSSPAAVPDRGAFRYPLLAGTLTRRESQVLLQLRDPLSIKEIARRQGLSYATVKRHSINIYSKLGVNNRWDAVALAIELGLIPER
jgi:LuxR family maltose regulon positive regulatory protein